MAMNGAASVRFAVRDGRTRLADLYQRAPLRVLFPNPQHGDVLGATVATTSGGLVGGDRLGIAVAAGDGAQAQVTAQAAEKAYRSVGADVLIDVRLSVGRDAWLEWLPQETILFEGARLRRLTAIDIAPGGQLMAGEMLAFGRTARGERLTRGLVRDAWEVRQDGRLVWADALHMDGDLAAPLDHAAGFGGARAYATAIYVGDDAGDHLAAARSLVAAAGVRAGVTVIGNVLIARWLGGHTLPVRTTFGAFWAAFRERVAGLPPILPRLWAV